MNPKYRRYLLQRAKEGDPNARFQLGMEVEEIPPIIDYKFEHRRTETPKVRVVLPDYDSVYGAKK